MKVLLNGAAVRVASEAAGRKLVRDTTREIARRARIRAAAGRYSSGTLARHVRIRGPYVLFDEVKGSVGAELPYAASVNGGARPHTIRPRGVGYPLRFFWEKVGHEVEFASVRHPGQRGNGFLSIPLAEVAAIHNMRLVP